MAARIIAITGASGSGKTHLTNGLYQELSTICNVAVIREDSYYRDQSHLAMAQRIEVNYDHPSSLEHELLSQHLISLKSGEAIEVPDYDYSVHNRNSATTTVKANCLIILEGILLLTDPQLRQHFDLSLFVDTPLDVCFSRRLVRDTLERGRTEASVREQFESTVKPMFHEFILPSRDYSELQISGEKNLLDMVVEIKTHIDPLITEESLR